MFVHRKFNLQHARCLENGGDENIYRKFECGRFKYSCSITHQTLEVGLLCGKRTKAEASDFENSVTMTMDVVFMAMNEVVLRITMGVTNFYCKIIRELTTEELEVSLRKTHTDKS